MTRLPRTLLRLLALAFLAALLIGVPLAVFRVVGSPLPGADQLRAAWSARRIDSDLVLKIGGLVFAILWLWFALTALAEAWQVLSWQLRGRRGSLAVLPPGPSGWVRSLVRFIAISSVTAGAAFSSLVPAARATTVSAAPARMSVAASTASVSSAVPVDTPTHRAIGRETPYSLAMSLGRPELRDQIIGLNAGRLAPDGVEWQGGVFPAGMEVVLPAERAVATMIGPAHEVVTGDSYWEIADDHLTAALGRPATEAEVYDYTDDLMTFNVTLLRHDDPALIHPGELVIYTDTPMTPAHHEVTPAATASTATAPTTAPATVTPHVVELPEVAALPVSVQPSSSPSPAAGPGPVPAVHAPAVMAPGETSSSVLPYAAGLAAAMMMSAGAVGLLDTRRRRALRAATIGARLVPPTLRQVRTEALLRSLDAGERIARLDLALRAAAPSLAAQSASVAAALVGDDGEITLFLRGAAVPEDALWRVDLHGNSWHLPAAASLASLAERARRSAAPCPAMVHLGGAVTGGDVFVDLEGVGSLSVLSPHATPILRHIAAALAVSPFLEAARVFTVGLGDVDLGSSNSEGVDSFDAAVDAALMTAGSTASLAHGATTFAMRAGAVGGEVWEPAVVVAATDEAPPFEHAIARALAGGRGLAVVADVPMEGDWQLSATEGCHVLEPLGLQLQPVGLDEADVAAVHELLTEPVIAAAEPIARVTSLLPSMAEIEPFAERPWALRVGLFGGVEVVARDGVVAQCERSKAVELIAWLGQHRERPTRSAARTALWDVEVRDATFANVVSDARRAMARAVAPPEGQEWISRTLTDDLPLHSMVVTDAELLAARLESAQGRAPLDAIDVLRPGVALLGGMPFAGTGYLWPDAEGATSSLVLLATSAAIELANHYLALGDVEGVFWASGQGLKVLSGHEELIALRMRAHARRGDLAGVRSEWESYERAIAADPWAASEPAPKLVALRRELLSTTTTPDAEGA